jgi:hypothetical protein
MLIAKLVRLAAIGFAGAWMISAAASAEAKREEGVLPSGVAYIIFRGP